MFHDLSTCSCSPLDLLAFCSHKHTSDFFVCFLKEREGSEDSLWIVVKQTTCWVSISLCRTASSFQSTRTISVHGPLSGCFFYSFNVIFLLPLPRSSLQWASSSLMWRWPAVHAFRSLSLSSTTLPTVTRQWRYSSSPLELNTTK